MRQVGVVQVIGLHPHRDQAAKQRLEGRRIVVDAFQQHRLAEQRDARPRQPPGCGLARRGQLARMVGVEDDIDRLLRL